MGKFHDVIKLQIVFKGFQVRCRKCPTRSFLPGITQLGDFLLTPVCLIEKELYGLLDLLS